MFRAGLSSRLIGQSGLVTARSLVQSARQASSLAPKVFRAQPAHAFQRLPMSLANRAPGLSKAFSTKPLNMKLTQSATTQNNTINLLAGGAAVAGTLAVAYAGYTNAEANGSLDKQVTSRVRYTYLYLAASLGITAATARALFVSGAAYRIATMNPWAAMALGLGGMIGAQMVTRSIAYENAIPKHLAWLSFCGVMGASLCPVAFAGGPLIMKAAVATGAVVSSLSLVSAAAPTDSLLPYGGVAAIGFGLVFAASMGRMFFPASPILYNVAIYGGAGVFSFFVMYDTQKIMRRARYEQAFDPINNCLGIYVDSINLFLTILQILQGRDSRRR